MSSDLFQELEREMKFLNDSLRALRASAEKYNRAERDYQIELRKKTFIMKNQGIPATLIGLTVKGTDEVAEKRFERDAAEAEYKANLEAINATKLIIRVIDNQISREWSTPLDD